MRMGFTLKGREAMMRRLAEFRAQLPGVVMQAMRLEAEIEATEARKRTPVYTGPTGPGKPIPGLLKASIKVEGPEARGRYLTIWISAGGLAGAYAIPQHENLDYFHEIGQAKYIESVLMESRPYIMARIAKRINFARMKNVAVPR